MGVSDGHDGNPCFSIPWSDRRVEATGAYRDSIAVVRQFQYPLVGS